MSLGGEVRILKVFRVALLERGNFSEKGWRRSLTSNRWCASDAVLGKSQSNCTAGRGNTSSNRVEIASVSLPFLLNSGNFSRYRSEHFCLALALSPNLLLAGCSVMPGEKNKFRAPTPPCHRSNLPFSSSHKPKGFI